MEKQIHITIDKFFYFTFLNQVWVKKFVKLGKNDFFYAIEIMIF